MLYLCIKKIKQQQFKHRRQRETAAQDYEDFSTTQEFLRKEQRSL